MNFSCLDIKSIGGGGGSIVRRRVTEGGNVSGLTVGLNSAGYKLTTKAIIFSGDVLTTTDYTVLAGPSNVNIGNPDLVKGRLTDDELAVFKQIIK
jgi:N-methylhydantoinase A/oxoprolinase/acetone carboxylase beta subunit